MSRRREGAQARRRACSTARMRRRGARTQAATASFAPVQTATPTPGATVPHTTAAAMDMDDVSTAKSV